MNKNKKKVFLAVGITVFMLFDVINFAFALDENSIQSALDKANKKLEQEKSELNVSKGLLQKNQVQVGTTKNKIVETVTEINRKESELQNLNDQIELYKKILAAYLQELYFDNQDPLIQLAMANENLNDIFGNTDQTLNIKEKILGLMQDIDSSQQVISQTKEELADKKAEHEKLLQQQKVAQGEIVGDIQESQATIAELQKKIAELRSALSSFLGKSYSTKDIDDAVAFASKATGVRKAFLQAELIVETGYGTFTGGCTYKNIRMKTADVNQFLKTADELSKAYGGDYKKKKLSCSPKWGGYGGAMGVAQFMPTTWIGYKAKISAKTGSNPADPWDLADGITGMAIKLAAGGATSKSGEFLASKRYYCGGPGSAYWNNKCNDYAKKVQSFSKDPESHI
ncbi:MAG: hypothetical protein UT50_C0014G0009 [Candidatus Moranbacteria bacterium GW2011_GWA2_39_41]|nr:MAG: hypothetical protein UT50_C0014G0009 [Candidatus Moranbacteria bacterium GW2011_GWA2_39_41]